MTALGIAPADGYAPSEGRWSEGESDAPVAVALPAGPETSDVGEWIVEDCADDILKLRRRSPSG